MSVLKKYWDLIGLVLANGISIAILIVIFRKEPMKLGLALTPLSLFFLSLGTIARDSILKKEQSIDPGIFIILLVLIVFIFLFLEFLL